MPSTSARHKWGERSELSPLKSETECGRCGVVRASLKRFDDNGRGSFWKEFWRDGDRVDAGDGSTPPCDARIAVLGITGGLLGDPEPGRSALDKRRAGQ